MPSKDPLRGKQNPSPSPQADSEEKIVVENINITGHTTRVNARMYHAMRQAMLKVLPFTGPGMTQAEIRTAVIPHLPEDLYPGGAKAGWWAKMVQLDL